MATLAVTIGRGTLAARPATMPAGSLYYVTDTSTLYRSNGATWDQIEAAAAAAYTDEQARDAIGAALVAGSGITVTVNDPSDTITVAATGTVIGTHTHVGADVTDFAEVTDDRLNALLVAGSGITLTYNDAANTLTVASSVSAGAPPHPRWVTGRYYGIQEIGRIQFTGGSLLTANRLYLTPLMVPAAVTVDRIGVQVTAAAATTNVRLGIYGDFSAAGSAALLLDAGTVDSSTTGGKELTISQALSAGWSWLAVISNGAPQVNSVSGWFGPNVHSHSSIGGTATDAGWVKDGTGGYTALPSTFTIAGATSFTSAPVPMVRST
jgi:hypothetical protein